MDINQDINYQKPAIDLSQFSKQKNLAENANNNQQRAEDTISTDAPVAATVSLSEKGRAASFTFDFNATADNLLKLDELRNSKSFAKAHASVSYERVKNILS